MEAESFEACTKPGPYKKLLFGLAFFNAVIQVHLPYMATAFLIWQPPSLYGNRLLQRGDPGAAHFMCFLIHEY